mmetsp:Transcript_7254/g.15898  ORF Transcript_7254/g.15898 Transcript_7254/m.15898 type:complete len:204 (+) Transcript_7254:286-897(+)
MCFVPPWPWSRTSNSCSNTCRLSSRCQEKPSLMRHLSIIGNDRPSRRPAHSHWLRGRPNPISPHVHSTAIVSSSRNPYRASKPRRQPFGAAASSACLPRISSTCLDGSGHYKQASTPSLMPAPRRLRILRREPRALGDLLRRHRRRCGGYLGCHRRHRRGHGTPRRRIEPREPALLGRLLLGELLARLFDRGFALGRQVGDGC